LDNEVTEGRAEVQSLEYRIGVTGGCQNWTGNWEDKNAPSVSKLMGSKGQQRGEEVEMDITYIF
jgi:hypothetical protein